MAKNKQGRTGVLIAGLGFGVAVGVALGALDGGFFGLAVTCHAVIVPGRPRRRRDVRTSIGGAPTPAAQVGRI